VLLAGLVFLLLVGLWIYALIDCATTDSAAVRNLPKFVWLLIVIFVPTFGSLLWLLLGRPTAAVGSVRSTDYRRRSRDTMDDHPRYSETAGISDRRSAELDREIELWEMRQRELKNREGDVTDE
jgi:Phospholipase_D-nuclease N-terminal